ncbi:MAG: N-acetyltransferase [Syntrophobacterales bacterium]|jgi:ribosomal protein S18 acetylase RimI-like enzyme
MIVRTATQEDFAKIIEIEKLSFPTAWDYDFLEKISKDIFLVFDGKEVCGYLIAGCCHRNVSATILKVAVHPEHRRKGIATDLFHKLVEILKDKNITEIEVIVIDECKPAILFYKKVGFKTVSTIPQPSNNDLHEMKLTIG